MKANYVLVDFENVQPKTMGQLQGGTFRIKVFLGASQTKISLELARAMQAFGPDAEYIQVSGNGPNALDFHIAYYIGQLAAETPDAGFYVISKDTGFDPLIKHLGGKGVACERLKSFAEIPLLKAPRVASVVERVDAVIVNLAKRSSGKPRSRKTLRSTIKALFINQITDKEIDGVIAQLISKGEISFDGDKVNYRPAA